MQAGQAMWKVGRVSEGIFQRPMVQNHIFGDNVMHKSR